MTNNSIEDLKRELTESQAQSHGLARRVVEAETKLEVAERDLTASNAALDQMTADAVNFKAEVERLTKELDAWDYGTRAKREQARAEKAEAEVAKINHQLLNTESDLIQSQAEVERLKESLKAWTTID
jgi:chromosome segregation ATPase